MNTCLRFGINKTLLLTTATAAFFLAFAATPDALAKSHAGTKCKYTPKPAGNSDRDDYSQHSSNGSRNHDSQNEGHHSPRRPIRPVQPVPFYPIGEACFGESFEQGRSHACNDAGTISHFFPIKHSNVNAPSICVTVDGHPVASSYQGNLQSVAVTNSGSYGSKIKITYCLNHKFLAGDACGNQDPAPAPSPSPTPVPVPVPAPSPSPVVVPEPTPSPSPVVVPEPTPSPSPVVVPEPTPSPSPVVVPEPTPAPSPSPVVVPEPAPAPSPSPSVDPAPTPIPTTPVPPEPSPSPSPVVIPEPSPSPSPVVTPAPAPSTVINISDFTAVPDISNVLLFWNTTGVLTKSIVRYGTTMDLEYQAIHDDVYSEAHTVDVEMLPQNTVFYFQVISIAEDGSTVTSPIISTRTKDIIYQ